MAESQDFTGVSRLHKELSIRTDLRVVFRVRLYTGQPKYEIAEFAA